jgi:hypothetical protein
MQKKISLMLVTIILTTSAFAADPVAKEDTATPAAAEALTLAQIQPLTDTAKFIPGAQNKPATTTPDAKPSGGTVNNNTTPAATPGQ